jgi:spore coat protein U-like protein
MLTKSKFVGLAALATLWAGPALAVDTNYQMNLKVTMGETCVLPTTMTEDVVMQPPLTDAAFLTGSKTFSISCSLGLNYKIKLDNGSNPDATNSDRRLKNGTANFIPYDVYRQTGNTSLWAFGMAQEDVTGTGAAQVYTFSIKSQGARSTFPKTGTPAVLVTGLYTDTLKFNVVFP